MKFTETTIAGDNLVLANDHFTARPYDCSSLTANTDGIIPAGTIVPANDSTAVGILLSDVTPDENPNGAIVTHGSVVADKLPETPADEAKTALNMIQFV